MVLWAGIRTGGPEPVDRDKAGGVLVAEKADPSTAEAETLGASGLDPRSPEQSPPSADPSTPGASTPSDSGVSQKEAAQPLSAEQLIVLQDVETDLADAFAGDPSEAVALASFLNQCQFTFSDRSRVEQSIARAERSFAEEKPLTQFRPTSPAQQFNSLAEFESNQWSTFFRCEAARGLINDDFWANLEQQVDAGNPVSRYLFATLMRDAGSHRVAFEHWDEELEHREQARGYTWRNLEEREPLGLLALVQLEGIGHAMRGIGGGGGTNTVLILAAVKCGLATPDLLQSVDQLLQQVERMEKVQPGALKKPNAASDEARRMFCK